jgi:hypothetical protein
MAFGEGIRDAIKEKSKKISDTLSEKYRERIGMELAEREQKLSVRETEYVERVRHLDALENELVQREKELHRNFLVPKVYVFVPLLLVVAAAGVFTAMHLQTPAVGPAGTTAAPGHVESQSVPSEGSCNARGIAYYREIGSFPRLSTGEDAERKVRDMCSRSNGLAFGR